SRCTALRSTATATSAGSTGSCPAGSGTRGSPACPPRPAAPSPSPTCWAWWNAISRTFSAPRAGTASTAPTRWPSRSRPTPSRRRSAPPTDRAGSPPSASRGQPGQVAGQLTGRDLGLLPGGHVPDGDAAGFVLRGAIDQRPAGPLVAGPFELAAELAGRTQVDAGPQPGRAGSRGEREAACRVALVHDRDRDIQPGVPLLPRRQHEQDPLDAERAAGRG